MSADAPNIPKPIQDPRRERLAKIAAEYTQEIYDPETRAQLRGEEPVAPFAAVTSEGSPESSFASNGNLLVAGSAEELAELLRQEAGEGWIVHGRAWDLDADFHPEGNLDCAYAVGVGSGADLAWSRGAPSSVAEVWVCTFEHRHGRDVWLFGSVEAAWSWLARVVRRDWPEALEVDGHLAREEGEPKLSVQPPSEDREAVERYFEVMGEAAYPEFFSIEHRRVLGASREA